MAGDVVSSPTPEHPDTDPTLAGRLLLVLALLLLIGGVPFALFGSFLAAIDGGGEVIPGGRYFPLGGIAAVACALGIKAYLSRGEANTSG